MMYQLAATVAMTVEGTALLMESALVAERATVARHHPLMTMAETHEALVALAAAAAEEEEEEEEEEEAAAAAAAEEEEQEEAEEAPSRLRRR